jgi:hypothetical protein
MRRWQFFGIVLSLFFLAARPAAAQRALHESARKIPVACDVDVIVVGGGTGAVAAALSAAECGASVFLAAPYPYLGDDMTATLRLGLEDGEEPRSELARAIFHDPITDGVGPHPDRLPLTYSASVPCGAPHRDTNPPSRLTNGRWGDAASQSVQYNGDVAITADLGGARAMREARIVVYQRDHGVAEKDFKVQHVQIATSSDGSHWSEPVRIENRDVPPGATGPLGTPVVLAVPLETTARFVRFEVTRTEEVSRVLLGEIEVLGAEDTSAGGPLHRQPPRPMHVKKTLERALIEAGVPFLFSCYPTDVLRDADGAPAGIVMANRVGRQAVRARTIIDASDRGTVARLAGARFRPYPNGTHVFRRTVIGGEPVELPRGAVRTIDPPFAAIPGQAVSGAVGPFPTIEYTLELNMPDGSYAAFAAADQQARSLTYHPQQQVTADRLFQIPPDPLYGRQSLADDSLAVSELPLDAFRPQDIDRLYVLGGTADISRTRAEQLMRPLEWMDLGKRLGQAAAAEAAALDKLAEVRLPSQADEFEMVAGEVRESLTGVRPIQQLPAIEQESRPLPVLGEYEVLVIGGGTGGAPAAIAAARQGARVLVVEYLHMMGGVGTAGYISRYWYGNRVGFTATVPGGAAWEPEQRANWWRQTLLDAGGEIWFGTIGCGALVNEDQVIGAVVATPFGRGAVLADVVIDATGNADIAAAAGAEIDYTDAREFGMQGTGLPPRRLGANYTNTDFTLVDETDLLDIWHVFVYSKQKYPDAFDQGQLIDTRERRRIVGDFFMTVRDQMIERTYPDTICQSRSNFDTHGYTIDPYLILETPPSRYAFVVNIPFRCLLPKGLEGILVTGLGISVHRDAVPLTRMQPDIQNQGYAAGLAATMAVQNQQSLRAIDVRALQRKLVEIDNLPEAVLQHQDSLPMSDADLDQAVRDAPEDYRAAAAVFIDPERTVPRLREAFAASEGQKRYAYAQKLAMLGDSTGAALIRERVHAADTWDTGWNYRGMGQFGAALSPLDVDIIALGLANDPQAVPVILEKVVLLDAHADFSHHRAVAHSLERLDDPAAAPALAQLLAKPDMTGHVHDTVRVAAAHDAQEARNTNAVHTRRESLRELLLARALYLLGDHEGVGQAILENYTHDLRGHLARHAQALLER